MKPEINVKLSLKKCWEMVNRIQLAKSPKEIRERCCIAEKWLIANEVGKTPCIKQAQDGERTGYQVLVDRQGLEGHQ